MTRHSGARITEGEDEDGESLTPPFLFKSVDPAKQKEQSALLRRGEREAIADEKAKENEPQNSRKRVAVCLTRRCRDSLEEIASALRLPKSRVIEQLVADEARRLAAIAE